MASIDSAPVAVLLTAIARHLDDHGTPGSSFIGGISLGLMIAERDPVRAAALREIMAAAASNPDFDSEVMGTITTLILNAITTVSD